MYLLILGLSNAYELLSIKFTSHYVSINSSADFRTYYHVISHLHPTMYLLIPFHVPPYPTFWTVFTSHYVSINSRLNPNVNSPKKNLHPTMYLLIPVIIKASLFLNSEALFCLPFKSANRLLILYALNMLEA